ncbi:serine/threonine-protein phosphatase 7 long form homolog [Chenopodium quinoa]|uniref:serine/threonine-protein phosphatase 7 long form homolog n=1 Tax=Chenopodium quinoa TaxID=63459 RepID=UPI000B7925A0|nr:serine/threonine-protein phosphatase 7 long form homolog [Chenopodium quinoa]
MRQFGLQQPIPQNCDTVVRLHDIDRRGKTETNWALEHWQYLQLWEQRLGHVVQGYPMQGVMDHDDPYMVWYRLITRRFINPSYTPPSTHYHPAHDVISGYAADMVAMYDALSLALTNGPTRAQVQRMRDMSATSLRRHGHGHLIQQRDGDDGHSIHSRFDPGQSSSGGDPTSHTEAEEYIFHSSAPFRTQEDASSSQLTPPPPRRNPFTTIHHYTRCRPRRRDDSEAREGLHQIDE